MNYSEMTDSALAELTKNGDCGAFEELVVRHHRAALGTAYRYVRSAQDAEDAVQEAFISAWLKLDSLRDTSRFGAWVSMIVRNRAKNIVMRKPDSVSFEEIIDFMGEDGGFAEDDDSGLKLIIASLPGQIAEAMTLHYFEGYSVKEIARMTNEPEGTVKWRLSEGRKRIRKEYGMNTKNNRTNIGLVDGIMSRIRSLIRYFRHDMTNFRPEYDSILAEIEKMPDSEEKDMLAMRIRLRGYYYDDALRTDENLRGIREIAVRLGDEDVLGSVCEAQLRYMDDCERVKVIREEMLPFAELRGFKYLTAELEFNLAQALHDCGEFDEARAYFCTVLESESADSVRYGIAKGAVRAIDELRDADKDKCFTSFGAYKYSCSGGKLMSGDYKCYNMYNFNLQYYAACGVFYNYELCDSLLHDSGMKPGDTVTSSVGDTSLTFEGYASVKTDCGEFPDCEKWRAKSDSKGAAVYWKRGIGVVKTEIETADEHSALILSEYTAADDGSMMPFAVGNKWIYRIEIEGENVTGTTEYEVIALKETEASMSEITKVFVK